MFFDEDDEVNDRPVSNYCYEIRENIVQVIATEDGDQDHDDEGNNGVEETGDTSRPLTEELHGDGNRVVVEDVVVHH